MKYHLPENVILDLSDEENIGVLVSGGADSALLLYLLFKHMHNDQHLMIFTGGSEEKGLSNLDPAKKVVAKCAELTGFKNFSHAVWTVDKQNNDNLYEAALSATSTGLIDQIFSATTSNPPEEILNTFKGINGDAHNRVWGANRPTEIPEFKVFLPFTNIDKSSIFRLYKHYALLDELFPLTRSCEAYSDVVLTEPCKRCWWCEERHWAFNTY